MSTASRKRSMRHGVLNGRCCVALWPSVSEGRESSSTFGTHAALFGVNLWRPMTWLGHKHIEETMRYVHVADSHRRGLPRAHLAAAEGEFDPDRRITTMGGRAELRLPDGNTKEGQRSAGLPQTSLRGGRDLNPRPPA